MKLTREQMQLLINALSTILIVVLSLWGYNVTILDPARRVILEQLETNDRPFVAGGMTHFSGLSLQAQTPISVTAGLTLPLSGTYQPLEAAGDAAFALPLACTAGDVVLLLNTVGHTLTLSDTANAVLAADWAGGEGDALLLWCDGTQWVEISRSDN
ncbi:MAG: hypothetical protein GX605_09120 [Chloroflexi bacterium]|nr:hypothetical protein [Chloroflexota bacterium]